ncbi:MAG: 4-hydroxy-tetrahydrodipicolinate synthase [Bacteroidales bacterium]|jgi:4-hydroxy-tetrahydrodipicolinate synthase|nr:4-hydroxy-tetrahydrodipicolinate synthase [Bacteroidales bacterium]
MRRKFSGTGVAVITPFNKKKEVDFPALKNILNRAIECGVDYIVTLGTTGETPTLSAVEKNEITRFTVEIVANRLPVVIGIGGNSTQNVVETIEKSDFRGIDGILSVTPYYNKPRPEGLYWHYKTISEAAPLPVIAYNVPGRTGVNMSAETTLRIANDCKNIVAIKEASGNIDQIMMLLKHRPKDFLIISGDDSMTFPMLAMGADGVISVAAQAVPKLFSTMVRFVLSENFEEARTLHFKMLHFMNDIFADGSPGGIKAALHIQEMCENELRLPLVPVDKATYSFIKNDLMEIEI